MESREVNNTTYQSTSAADGASSVELGDGWRGVVTEGHAASDDDTCSVNVSNDFKANLVSSARAASMPLCYDSAYLLSNRELLEKRRWHRDYLANSATANSEPNVGAAATGPSTRQRRMAALRNRALKSRRHQSTVPLIPSSTTIDNWAQCENCKKWRRLPPFVETEALPETWVCALNIWDPRHMSCRDPEETVNEIRMPPGTGRIEIEHDIGPCDNLSNLGAASSPFHNSAGLSLAQQLSVVLPSSKDHASIYLKDEHKQEHGQLYQIPGSANATQVDANVGKGSLADLQHTHDFGHGIGPGSVPGVVPGYRREVIDPEEDYAGDVFKLILKDARASEGNAGDDAAEAVANVPDPTRGSGRSSRNLKTGAAAESNNESGAVSGSSLPRGGSLKNSQDGGINSEIKVSSTRVPTSNRLVVYSREANSLVASQLPHRVVLFEAAKRPMRKSKRLKEHVWADDAHAHIQDEVGPILAPLDSHGKIVNRISGVTRAVENLKDEGYHYDANGYPVADADTDADYNRDNKAGNDEDDEHEKTADQKPAAEEEEDLEQKQDELDLGVGFGSDAKWPKPTLPSTMDTNFVNDQSFQLHSSIKNTRPALVSLFPLLSLQIPTLPTMIPTTLPRQGSLDDAQQTTIDTQLTLGGDFFNSSVEGAISNIDGALDDGKVQVLTNEQVLGALEALGKSAKDSVAADGDAAPSTEPGHLGRHCTSVNMVLEPESCEPPLMIPMQVQSQQIAAPGTGALPLYGSLGLIPGGSVADAAVDLDPLLQPLEKLAQPLHYYSRRTTRSDRFPTSSCGTIADLLREQEELERKYIHGDDDENIYADGGDGAVAAASMDGKVDLDTSGGKVNLVDDASPAKDFENSQEKLEAYPALDVTSTRSRLFAPKATTRYPQQLPLDPQRRALQKLREHYAISSLGKSYFKRLRGMRPDVDYPAPDFKTLRKFAQGRGHGATGGHASNSSDLEPDDASNTRESWTRYYHHKSGTSADLHVQDSRGSNEQFSSVSEMGEDLLGSNYRRLSNRELDDDAQAVGKLILGLDRDSMLKLYQPIDYKDLNASLVNTSNSSGANITADYVVNGIPVCPTISGATAQLVQSLSKPIPSNLYRFDTQLLERLSCEIEYPASIDVRCGANTLLGQP